MELESIVLRNGPRAIVVVRWRVSAAPCPHVVATVVVYPVVAVMAAVAVEEVAVVAAVGVMEEAVAEAVVEVDK